MSNAVSVSTVKRPALQIATGAAGAMASKVVAPFVPGGATGKILLALGFGVVAAVSPAKGAGKQIQAAAIGAGVIQFTEGISEILAPTVAKWADSGEPSKFKDLVKKSVGLAAADSSYYEELLRRNAVQAQQEFPAIAASTEPAGV